MRRLPVLLVVIALLAISWPRWAFAAIPVNDPPAFHSVLDLDPYGCGGIFSIALWRNYAYCSGDGDPVNFSASVANPDSMQYVHRFGYGFGHGGEAVIADGKLYIANWSNYLDVFDPSLNPGYYNFLGDYITWISATFGIDVVNNRAYVMEVQDMGSYYRSGLCILNVSNPGNIKSISVTDTYDGQNVGAIAIRGSYAFLKDDHRFEIMNISDETSPYIMWSQNLGYSLGDIKLRDNYAYVTGDTPEAGLWVFDISNPTSPSQVGHITAANALNGDICLLGNYAFLGAGGGFTCVDISNPASPQLRWTEQTEGYTDAERAWEYSVAGKGKYMYVGTQELYYGGPYGQIYKGKLYSYEVFPEDPDDVGPTIWSNFTPSEASWDTEYFADALPSASSPPWTIIEGSEANATVSGGVLRINDTTGTADAKWTRNWDATNTRGTTLLVRAKCDSYDLNGVAISSLNNISIEDGKKREQFAILSDRIRSRYSNQQYMLSGNEWHTYRITTQGTQFKVYVDEAANPVITGSFASTSQRARIMFGVGANSAKQDISFDFVQCFSNGVYAPGAKTWDTTPDISATAADFAGKGSLSGIKPASAAVYWSTDGGNTWSWSGGPLWDCQYEADAMPSVSSPAWAVPEGSEIYGSVSDGVLRVYDNSTLSGSKIKWARSWNASPSKGATVFARIRCAAIGGNHTLGGNIYVEDGSYKEIFKICTDRVEATQSGQVSATYDATQWHTYRVTAKNGTYNVYLDENPTPLMTGSMVASTANNRVMFGSGASAGTQDIYFDYVRYAASGDLPPGEGDGGGTVTVTCTGADGNEKGTVTALAVPFNQTSETLNKVRFSLKDVNGNTGFSPLYNVRVASTVGPPGPVTNFTATRGDSQVSLSWTKAQDPDVAGTMIRFKTTGYPTSSSDGTQVYSGPGTSYLHYGLTNGVTYYYSAWAFDTEGYYSTKVDASATPVDLTPPSPVTSFTGTAGDKQVTLNWTNPTTPDFTGTMIRYKTTGYPSSSTDGTLVIDKPNSPGTTDSYVHTGLGNGIIYYYSAFAHDAGPNYASRVTATARPAGESCFFDGFSYLNGNLNGNGGWTGTATTQIQVVDQTVKLYGGASDYYAAHTVACGPGASGVISVRVKIKAGVGTSFMWNLWIDDPNGNNLARWYGTGTSARGRIDGSNSLVTAVQPLTGNWDILEVRIHTATDQSEFRFNGTSIGTLSHSSYGAGDTVGTLTFEQLNNSGVTGNYVFFDDLFLGEADTTAPAPVTGFAAVAGNHRSFLAWGNPADADFAGVKILFKTTGYPSGPNDGTVAYQGTETTCTHDSLANGTTYYYAAYAYDEVPNYSTAAQANATPIYFTPVQAKLLGDNTELTLTVGVVSAVFGDSFYVQCVDPACGVCGIKVVNASHDKQVGQPATVKGTILTDPASGERYISATSVR